MSEINIDCNYILIGFIKTFFHMLRYYSLRILFTDFNPI